MYYCHHGIFWVFFRGPNFSCAPLFLFPWRVFKYCVGGMVVHWDGHSSPRAAAAASLWARTVTKGCPTCALHKDLIDTEDDLSCSSGSHARASGIIFFTPYTKQVNEPLYQASFTSRCAAAACDGQRALSQQRRQPALVPRAHRHTHTHKQTYTHIYVYIYIYIYKISMSDATSSTMLVSHHRYFIAHSLVSLFFVNKQWSTPNTHAA